MFAKSTMRLVAASLALPIVFLTGCGGGNNNNGITPTPTPTSGFNGTPTPSPTPANVPSATVIGITSANTLIRFNTRTPGTTTTLPITGLSVGEDLLAIDYRFAPGAGGATGLYGLTRRANGGFQLNRINFSGDSASLQVIGPGFDLANVTSIGFDFNPNVIQSDGSRVDRIRLVSPTRVDARLNADAGALVDNDPNTPGQQNDGDLTFAAGDANQNTAPRVIGAAYTNNDTDPATGTTLYVIDAATNSLAIQGRAASDGTAAVSPNSGQLFTVGSLGLPVGDQSNSGFDIAPGNNTAFASFSGAGTRLYTIDLGTGRASLVGNVGMTGTQVLVGLAIVP